MNDKEIILKKGINRKMLILTSLALLAMGLLFTSKRWLPDDRVVMKRNAGAKITFEYETVIFPEEVYYDEQLNILEFDLQVTTRNAQEDRLSYQIMFEDGTLFDEKTFHVIQSDPYLTTTGVYQKDVIVQCAKPDDFYYLRLAITQDDYKTEEFYIDYRNLKKKKLTEKGSAYLRQFNAINQEIAKAERILEEAEKEKNSAETNVRQQEKMIEELEMQMELITDDKEKEEKNKPLNELKEELTKKAAVLSEKEELVKDYQKQYETLLQERKELE